MLLLILRNFCQTIGLCYFLLLSNTSSAQLIYIQGDVVNIRSAASTSGTVVVKAKRLDELTMVRRDKLDVVNGMEDYWYVVRTPAGKEGFVFGHFTSWKREGQQTAELTFDQVGWGDCFHLVFGELDFGDGLNDLGSYEAILEDESNPNPRFIGKRFRVVYNELFAMRSDYCNPEHPAELVKVPTIVSLELLR